MAFGSRNSSAIDRRLQELQREMARLEREMKSAGRSAARAAAPPQPVQRPAADLFEQSDRAPEQPPPPPPPPPDTPFKAGGRGSRGRERFANYFMAGHFQDMRPSRRDMRILRNKAILMLALATLLLILLFYVYVLN